MEEYRILSSFINSSPEEMEKRLEYALSIGDEKYISFLIKRILERLDLYKDVIKNINKENVEVFRFLMENSLLSDYDIEINLFQEEKKVKTYGVKKNKNKLYIKIYQDDDAYILEKYYPSGKIKSRKPYLGNNVKGECIKWYEDGIVKSKYSLDYCDYDEEVIYTGLLESYYPNGNIKLKSEYNNGGDLIHSFEFCPDGKKKIEKRYVRGNLDIMIEYCKTENKKREIKYLTNTMYYDELKEYLIDFYPDGKKRIEKHYYKGNLDIIIEYWITGDKKCEIKYLTNTMHYSKHKLKRYWIDFYPDDKKRIEKHYVDGNLDSVIEYHPNGEIRNEMALVS